jgi:hypothetical protein
MLTVGETSDSRHLKFSDAAAELFQFTAVVKGQFPDPAFVAAAGHTTSSKRFKIKLHFIANPATGSVKLAGIEQGNAKGRLENGSALNF